MAAAPDSDSFSIDMQIYDTRTYPGKKGRKMTNSSGMSEDEVSLTGSPSLSRRRLGSFNGSSAQQNSGKEERSPGTF